MHHLSPAYFINQPLHFSGIFVAHHQEVYFFVALRPNAGHDLLIFEVSRSHTTTHHSRQDSSGRVISSSQRPLPDNTQHSQRTNIHAPSGIQTHDLSRRAATDHQKVYCIYIYIYIYIYTQKLVPVVLCS